MEKGIATQVNDAVTRVRSGDILTFSGSLHLSIIYVVHTQSTTARSILIKNHYQHLHNRTSHWTHYESKERVEYPTGNRRAILFSSIVQLLFISSIFTCIVGLSVKMMMLDQVNNYIHTPLAQIFNRMTDFAKVFHFITPNMISFMGFLSACVAAKLIMVSWQLNIESRE